MTSTQWEQLKRLVRGETPDSLSTGFIIDSPWLPGWSGVSILDYLSVDDIWFECNIAVNERFPDITFLPGFWMEYGMCTEPSAFGCVSSFPENEFPFSSNIIETAEDIDRLRVPDVRTDGFLPIIMRKMKNMQARMRDRGHGVFFATSRGPSTSPAFDRERLCGAVAVVSAGLLSLHRRCLSAG